MQKCAAFAGGNVLLSEQELQTKLQRPRSMRCIGMQKVGPSQVSIDACAATTAAPAPLCMVENVVGLCAKLETQ